MTNRERYKQAFSALQTSATQSMEVEMMAMIQKKHKKNIAVAAAVACAALIGVSGTVYAADIGGIQQKVRIWMYGKEEEVVITEKGDGSYLLHYVGDGQEELGFGGVAIGEDENGDTTESWLSPDELVISLNQSVDIAEDTDGRVWIYYYDQKADITDLFDEEGICKVQLTHEGETVYLEIEQGEVGDFAYSKTNEMPEDRAEYYAVEMQHVGAEEKDISSPVTADTDSLPEAQRAKSVDIPAAE